MGKFIDLSNRKFGQVTVISKQGKKAGRIAWLCLCDCGNNTIKTDKELKVRVVVSCGCHLSKNKTTKVCPICKKNKTKSDYAKLTTKSSGVQTKCKECTATLKKERYWNNHELELGKMTKSRLKPENILQRKDYYIKNKASYNERYKKYMSDESKRINKKLTSKLYLQKQSTKNKQKEYYEKRKTEMSFTIRKRLRSRIRKLVVFWGTREVKKKYFIELLGCSIDFFISYFENKFTYGMSWDRISEIHIDHIKPCAKFDLTNIEQQKKCFHYSNLQPLWKLDNLKKGTFYDSADLI